MSPFDRAHVTSYKSSIATIGLCRTVSEIDGDFSRKSQNFPHPLIFCVPAEGTLESGTGAGVKKLEWWATGLIRKFNDIFSRVDQCTNVTDGRTDGETPGDSKDRAVNIDMFIFSSSRK